jgi:hypothetical protein
MGCSTSCVALGPRKRPLQSSGLTRPRLGAQLHDGFARAWRERENWPETLKRRFADYHMNEVAAFLGRVSIVVLNRCGPSWFADRQKESSNVA